MNFLLSSTDRSPGTHGTTSAFSDQPVAAKELRSITRSRTI